MILCRRQNAGKMGDDLYQFGPFFRFYSFKHLFNMSAKNNGTSVLTKIILGGISVLIADYLMRGVSIDTWTTGFILAAVIILINFTLKPIMVILTFPITLLTFGLFLLVINAGVILIAAYFVPGFSVGGFWWALGFSLVVSLINSVFGISLSSDR